MTRTFHNDEVWAVIREDYLRGDTQPGLAERYGVGVSTIRDRARREGWRKRDQPSALTPALDLLPPAAGAEPMRPAVACVADAYRAADDALRAGRFIEAQRCLAIARGFERLAARTDGLARALSDHWEGEAEAWSVRHDPPWPPGVADPDAGRAALAALTDDYRCALTHLPLDFGLLSALADRMARLRACLDLTDEWEANGVPFERPAVDLPAFTVLGSLEALEDRPLGEPDLPPDPPFPPFPPCETTLADDRPRALAQVAPPAPPEPPCEPVMADERPERDGPPRTRVVTPEPPGPPDPPDSSQRADGPEIESVDTVDLAASTLADYPLAARAQAQALLLRRDRRTAFGHPWDDVGEALLALRPRASPPPRAAPPHGRP